MPVSQRRARAAAAARRSRPAGQADPAAAPAPPRRCRRCPGSRRCRTRTPSPPGARPGRRTCQSPGPRISSASTHRGRRLQRRVVGAAARRRPARPSRARCPTPATGTPPAAAPARPGVSSQIVNLSRPARPRLDHRVVEAVAEQVQRDQRVDPRRLDAAPAAVLLLPRDDPLGAPAHRGRAGRPRAGASRACRSYRVQHPVEPRERRWPAEPAIRSPGVRLAASADAGARSSSRPNGSGRTGRSEPTMVSGTIVWRGPARPVVDVQREPGGQVDQLGRHDRQVVPGPLAEQRQPDAGEHPGRLDAAAVADPGRRRRHVRGVGRVAGQPQRHVRLDRGGQVAVAAAEVRPGAVGALAGPDPPGRRRGLLRRSGCRGTRAAAGPRRPW